MTFEFRKHVIKVNGGKEYLPVAWRLVWFREDHPDWGIETRPIEINTSEKYCIYEATIKNETGRIMAVACKMEDAKGFGDYIEKANTGAIGRALALCGYGTQFEPEFDEVDAGRVVDAPQEPRRGNQGHPAARPTAAVVNQPRPFPTEESMQPHSAKQEIILALGKLEPAERQVILAQMNEQFGHRNVNAATDEQLQWVGARMVDLQNFGGEGGSEE